ncbi:MAG: ATP-dependent sacrificial sulfur transferase LarE [Deltaproteobacteria bacterium]|nr:ATP-dependent sacrificial sulfur transferase LarE [Deltaproteobacteria bacterium]
MDPVHEKLALLKNALQSLGSLAVAFSGGVDSTFLLKVAHDVLSEGTLAVTARSSTYPEKEFADAVRFITDHRIPHVTIVSEELDIERFADNPPNRCYFCKRELFSKIVALARDKDIRYVADGSNCDDLGDYRPGMQALRELGIISPLKEAKMTKQDIRILSKEMNLPTWDKPALACLASRLPYGHKITREKLSAIDRAEQCLRTEGFRQVRVRHHGDVARIEVAPEERARFFDEALMDRVSEEFKKLGFAYTALDLKGYRTGSMNETIL